MHVLLPASLTFCAFLCTGMGEAQAATPNDTLHVTKPRIRALKAGGRIVQFGGPHLAITYEQVIKGRISSAFSLGGRYYATPIQIGSYDPATQTVTVLTEGKREYTSLVAEAQIRYYALPGKQALTGLYAGLGIGVAYENFWRDYASFPGVADSFTEIHTPVSCRLGYQFRLGPRFLLECALGLDVNANPGAPKDPNRQWTFLTEAQVTSARSLQVGYRF
ncbi:hypothetical protein F0P96_10095 [Hymenobacter busanensis]|uniref:Uncharacterized protein n=1 Tax=Hymenobacter busanensis TaxID=2607656 RepID=A0A7L4ZXP1_9BACT|nr:hypothetical protein [Hymenobacter busanensis]KAA9333313.1 hypothetical protein F0P96_10095 [Hymenobacter busanensis]QHJ08008.1 hypothetical protein GUY19_12215 [Hymenobacter busanensis]